MFCTAAANTHRTSLICSSRSTDRAPRLPFNQTIIIPTLSRTLLHRLLASYANNNNSDDEGTSRQLLPSSLSSLLEEVGTCVEAIFVENTPSPTSSPPSFPQITNNTCSRGGGVVLSDVVHAGESVLGIVGGILLRDLSTWLVRMAEGRYHDSYQSATGMTAFHRALQDIRLYGSTFCMRDVGRVRTRQHTYISSRYEEERTSLMASSGRSGGERKGGSGGVPSSKSDGSNNLTNIGYHDDDDEGFVLGFMELLCDALQGSEHQQSPPPPPSSSLNTADAVRRGDSSSTSSLPPPTDFGRVQRNCNTYNITATHENRLKGKRAFSYVMELLQSFRTTTTTTTPSYPPGSSDTPTSKTMLQDTSSSSLSSSVPSTPTTKKLTSVPILLCHVFPASSSSSSGKGPQVDISPLGAVCLWETLLHAVTNSSKFVGTLQPDLVALSMWMSSTSSRSRPHPTTTSSAPPCVNNTTTTTGDHQNHLNGGGSHRSHHHNYIRGGTTWDALVGGRRYCKVEFKQGDAILLAL